MSTRVVTAVVATLVSVIFPIEAGSQTLVTGQLPGSATWTASGNPYVLTGDVVVPPGATLTIEAGVNVVVLNTDDQASGLDAARIELIVNGSLAVNGSFAERVTIAPQAGVTGSAWELQAYTMKLEGASAGPFQALMLVGIADPAGTVTYANQPAPRPFMGRWTLQEDGSVVMAQEGASAPVVEVYADYQCPWCGRFHRPAQGAGAAPTRFRTSASRWFRAGFTAP